MTGSTPQNSADRTVAASMWENLRTRELEAALKGGADWDEFVAECERLTGWPWKEVRKQFSYMDRRPHAE